MIKNGTLSMINQTEITMLQNEIICNTEVLQSNPSDYNDACILVSGDITDLAVHTTQVAFKSFTSFAKVCVMYHKSR